jgi:hypothetical protein
MRAFPRFSAVISTKNPQIRLAGFGSQQWRPVTVHRRHQPEIPESIAAAFREMLERSPTQT